MSARPTLAEALAGAVRRRLWLARLVLLWERLWPALWPATGVVGVFAALALFDVWALVPGWLHAALLIAFGAALALAVARGVRRLRLPGADEALRRIEHASGLAHRPLATLRDRPAGDAGDPVAQGLWRVHLDRVARTARRLRVGLASPGLARHDPLGLRAALLLVLVIALVAAGGDAGKRLARAFYPDFVGSVPPGELTLWLTPPEYTGAAPMFLVASALPDVGVHARDVVVPSGSTVLARVHGGRGTPKLAVDDETTPFKAVDSANYELSATLTEGRRIAVTQDGAELGAWPMSVIADQPPVIAFAASPGRTQRSALRLDYLAEDDYGLAEVAAVVRLADDPEQAFEIELPLPERGARSAEETSFHDLTPHPWAGLEVTITLTASDAIDQVGTSEAVATVLPERIFNHPVARAIIEQRKRLTLEPEARAEVSNALDRLSLRPEHFFEDLDVFLGLRAARWRLLYDLSDEAIAETQDLMWDLALTIEDGPVALAEEALREAQRKLLEALANDAPDEEIDRLIDELLATLDDFLDSLIEQAKNRGEMGEGLEDQMLQAIERDQLRQIVERIRELARTGAREAARELLSQLQMALENLRAGNMAGMQNGEMGEGEAALRDLEKMIDRQQKLLDETFRWSQGQGESGAGKQGLTAGRQEGLRQRLGDLMRRWGETGSDIPRSLARAERAMRDAVRALTDRLPGQAIGPQTDAIDQMQQGARSMLDSLLEQMGRAPPRPGQMMGPFGGETDPLGRALFGRGYQDDGRTRVPDEADLQRSREIIEELYRRAGEFDRPKIERDYINRLLQRF